MKKIRVLFLLTLIFAVKGYIAAQQEEDASDIFIIHEILNEDDSHVVVKKTLPKCQLKEKYPDFISTEKSSTKIGEVRGKNHNIITINKTPENPVLMGDTIILFRNEWKRGEIMCNEYKSEDNLNRKAMNIYPLYFRSDPLTGKAWLGVFPKTHEQGVLLEDIVPGSGAAQAGLQSGDILTAIGNYPLRTEEQLREVLKNFKPAQTTDVQFLRNGNLQTLQVTLGEKYEPRHTPERFRHHHRFRSYPDADGQRNPCDVFIGVITSAAEDGKEGVRVLGIIPGWPAETARLLPGDYIIAINQTPVNNHDELVTERNKHKPGDFFTISYLRNDEPFEVKARFKSCPDDKPENSGQVPAVPVPQLPAPPDNTLKMNAFEVFPNPTYGTLNLRFAAEAAPTQISILDTNGQLIYQESLPNFDGWYNRRLDVSQGVPGMLYLSIRQNGNVFTQPLLLLNKA